MPETTSIAGRALAWLRAGYPRGVPRGDYVALLGVLRRSLTPTEVEEIADELALSAMVGEEVTVDDVRRLISEATLDEPSPADVTRVSSHLAAGGWPLADTTA